MIRKDMERPFSDKVVDDGVMNTARSRSRDPLRPVVLALGRKIFGLGGGTDCAVDFPVTMHFIHNI